MRHRLFPVRAGLLALIGAFALLSSCSSSPISARGKLSPSAVPAAIERARSTPASEASDRTLAEVVGDLLRATRSELGTDQRTAVTQLLERWTRELATRSNRPGDLEDLAEAEMPARTAVPAALRAARLHLDAGRRDRALRVIRRLDLRFPAHAQKDEAGDLLYEIARSFQEDKRARLFLFPYSARAPEVYEYLSTEYPTHDKSDDALVELADAYAKDRRYDLAIERHKDLLLWSRNSPHVIASEAAIPQLRLDDLDGPEYGRDELQVAERELLEWIQRHGNHELRPQVDRALVDCLQRLADNDLVVARFYRRVKNPEGARNHAMRGLEYARRSGNQDQQAELRDFLASVDEIERVDAPRVLPDDLGGGIESFDPTGTGSALGTSPLAPSEPLDPDSRRGPTGAPVAPADPVPADDPPR